MNRNLILRSFSGIIYIAVIVCACLCGSMGCTLLASVFALVAIAEFKHMFAARLSAYKFGIKDIVNMLAVATLCLPVYGRIISLIFIIIRMVMAVYDKGDKPLLNVIIDFCGYVYIGIPMLTMSLLGNAFDSNGMIVLAIFIMIWLNDTGAYCIGSTLGRHKMFPRVSPKKSWEGFFGGMTFCVIFGILIGLSDWQMSGNIPSGKLAFWIIASLLTCLGSTYGDLFESFIKRNLSLKDSGNIIPGHGGILDRIDSTLLVMPVIFLLYVCWTFLSPVNCTVTWP